MRRKTVRITIVLAVITVAGILVLQVYWGVKTLTFQHNAFQKDVEKSLYKVAESLTLAQGGVPVLSDSVTQLAENYYVALVNAPVDPSLLEQSLKAEFRKHGVAIDYDYCVYDCQQHCVKEGTFFSSTSGEPRNSLIDLPAWQNDGNYFAVQFPSIRTESMLQFRVWTISSSALLVVVGFLGYAIWIILRQRKLSEVQQAFIHNMTHEFKTPLTTINLSAAALQQQAGQIQSDRLVAYTAIIQDESKRLHDQVERVLQIGKLEKHQIELRKEAHNLHELIGVTLDRLNDPIQEKAAHIETQFEAPDGRLSMDVLHLGNALYNLLDNALKYCDRQPHIRIRTHTEGSFLVCRIEDNGLGLSDQQIKFIFDKFYRVPSGNIHNIKGFGLGLNYVKLVVEAHGGKITVQSTLEKGSTFILKLPSPCQ